MAASTGLVQLGTSGNQAPKSSLPFKSEGPLQVPAEAKPVDEGETMRKRPGAGEASAPTHSHPSTCHRLLTNSPCGNTGLNLSPSIHFMHT